MNPSTAKSCYAHHARYIPPDSYKFNCKIKFHPCDKAAAVVSGGFFVLKIHSAERSYYKSAKSIKISGWRLFSKLEMRRRVLI